LDIVRSTTTEITTMIATTSQQPAAQTVLPATTPSSWRGVPVATFEWNDPMVAPTPVFATTDLYPLGKRFTTVEHAIADAVPESRNLKLDGTTAGGVFQAADGAFFLAQIGARLSTPNDRPGFYFPQLPTGHRVHSVTALIDGLKAIVGGDTTVHLNAVAGDALIQVPVAPAVS
jgi:hypothetical protein